MWDVELYEKPNGRNPILEFLAELNPKERAKVIREIDLLAEFGPGLIFPHSRKIEGEPNNRLWELRPQLGTNAFRILYTRGKAEGKETFMLLHAFRKKTNKTPEKELARARNRLTAYLEGSDEVE